MGAIPAIEECNPQILPMEYNVLVAPEETETRTAGGIILLDKTAETEQLASQKGRLVALSPHAFSYADWPEGARKPQIGDAVLFAKYAGGLIDGADKREYRVLKDKDIIAVLTA
jgi:co-chaperonin GroES (HSP10)